MKYTKTPGATVAASPAEALAAHVAVIRALRHPSHGKALIGSLAHVDPHEPRAREAVGSMTRTLADKLDRAQTIVVTEPMLDLVLSRMDSVVFGEPLEEEDLPFDAGFVLLPRLTNIHLGHEGIYDPSLMPRHVAVALSGGAWVKDRVVQVANDDPMPGVQWVQLVPRDQLPMPSTDNTEDLVAFEEGREVLRAMGMPHIPMYLSGWAFGLSWDPQYREESYVLTDAGEWERRFWKSLWRTLGEEIVAPVSMPRNSRRAAARLGLVPDVVVCQLRRLRHRDGEERLPTGETVMWSHSWRVRGHMRTLHRGTPQERKVPVRPYIKGHGPLIEKDRVWRLSR